ncbi:MULTISPECIES: DUF6104 family protein [unclassified Streptomyces]|uniref:DUF6104 family protein n=1 Tax=unclassified Streptomyces TaxID=2593676 RepID=UPI0018F7C0CA|nr:MULTISPECIES: DUF6104 family protein [unclassified Streptomyces]
MIDQALETLRANRGAQSVNLTWLAGELRYFVDLNPDFEVPVDRLTTWPARLDDLDDDE